MLEILMYIFEKFMGPKSGDRDTTGLYDELEDVGFGNGEIHKTLIWLAGLANYDEEDDTNFLSESQGVRIYAPDEIHKLGKSCMGFIHFLEQTGILTSRLREILIERAMALDIPKLNLFQLKWVTLFTLFYQIESDSDRDLSWLEALVFAEADNYLN